MARRRQGALRVALGEGKGRKRGKARKKDGDKERVGSRRRDEDFYLVGLDGDGGDRWTYGAGIGVERGG
jgi:hypothetical protein